MRSPGGWTSILRVSRSAAEATLGTLEVGWYAPHGIDEQQPHDRDELYVVAQGHARFAVDGEGLHDVRPGDVLFAAGPEGGE